MSSNHLLSDLAGIGPKLIARLLAEPDVHGKAHIVLSNDLLLLYSLRG